MKRTLRISSVVLCLAICASTLCGTFSASAQGISKLYSSAFDLSGLTPGDYRDNQNWACVPNTESELFTEGYCVDPPAALGVGLSNFHGFWADDTNGDGRTDRLKTHPYNDGGMRFTLGLNVNSGRSQAEGIAIYVGNDHAGAWGSDAWQSIELTLNNFDGTTHALKSMPDILGVSTVFVQDDYNRVFRRDISQYGYNSKKGIKNGWVILPLSAFSGDVNPENIISVNFNMSSHWNEFVYITDIGFTNDIEGMVTNLTALPGDLGFDSSYIRAVDFSDLTASREAYIDGTAYEWSCNVNTESEIFTKGIWVNKASEIGVGKTNFHGFYANDTNADGKADNLEIYPYNSGGVNFNLGVNSKNTFTDATAIAIRIDGTEQNVWGDASIISLVPTIYTSGGKGITVKPYSQNAGISTVNIYNDTKEAVRRDIATYSYGTRVNKDCWYIIPFSAFSETFDINDIVSVKLDMESYWGANIKLCDIGFVKDINEFISYSTFDETMRPASPTLPSIYAKGDSTVKVTAIEGYEYSIDGISWYSSNVFNNCIVGKTATVYQRVAATDGSYAGLASEPLSIEMYYAGDINHDNVVNASDILVINKHLLDIEAAGDLYAADANLDGQINVMDLVRAKRIYAQCL